MVLNRIATIEAGKLEMGNDEAEKVASRATGH